jgi:REP element-mobilizing transposase RayT
VNGTFHCNLPHWQKAGAAYFVTWRLYGSLPLSAVADCWTTEGAKFLQGDRLLDASASGPRWLLDSKIADAIVNILLNGKQAGRYELGAWVLMPNHVHLILRPPSDLPGAMSWIKACSARDANRLLGRTEQFWARNYFDRWIRSGDEEQRITRYIEQNPVKAGLCSRPEDWAWSSASAHRDTLR